MSGKRNSPRVFRNGTVTITVQPGVTAEAAMMSCWGLLAQKFDQIENTSIDAEHLSDAEIAEFYRSSNDALKLRIERHVRQCAGCLEDVFTYVRDQTNQFTTDPTMRYPSHTDAALFSRTSGSSVIALASHTG